MFKPNVYRYIYIYRERERRYYMVAQRYAGFYLRVVKTICNYCAIFFLNYIDSMQKAVNDVIDIFTSEDMANMSLVIF